MKGNDRGVVMLQGQTKKSLRITCHDHNTDGCRLLHSSTFFRRRWIMKCRIRDKSTGTYGGGIAFPRCSAIRLE